MTLPVQFLSRPIFALVLFASILPLTVQAAETTCASTVCSCVVTVDTKATDYRTTDASSCIGVCEDFVTNGTVSWYFTCIPESGVASFESGTLTRSNDTTTPAAGETEARDPVIPILNVPIPGLDFGDSVTYDADGNLQANFLAKYIDALYRFLIVAMAIVAVVMVMIAGLQYMLARGHADAIKKAKARIANAVIGLVILMAAYNIAFLINPDTVRFEPLSIKTIPYQEAPEESSEELASYGQTGEVAAGDVMTISAADAQAHHVIVSTQNKFVAENVYNALIAAADDFYTATEAASDRDGLNVLLTSASRTVQSQAQMFYTNCIKRGGYCKPDTCNVTGSNTTVVKKVKGWELQGEYASMSPTLVVAALTANGEARNCMHTNNVAVDVWAEGSGEDYTFNVADMTALTSVMYENGFCRIPNEPWHFELDTENQASSSCTQTFKTADYRRKNNGVSTTYSTSGCKTWSYNGGCCTDPADSANKPSTMCKN